MQFELLSEEERNLWTTNSEHRNLNLNLEQSPCCCGCANLISKINARHYCSVTNLPVFAAFCQSDPEHFGPSIPCRSCIRKSSIMKVAEVNEEEIDDMETDNFLSKSMEEEGWRELQYQSPTRLTKRRKASEAQNNQAQRMVKDYAKDLPELNVGHVVKVRINEVDRAKTDVMDLPCVVVEITSQKNYRLAAKGGVLRNVYPRSELILENDATPELRGLADALTNWRTMRLLSVREALAIISPTGGQGFFKCNCQGKCDDRKCKCKKNNLKCNSRCHTKSSCCVNK
jgi:hypothetical protein